jgi:hypothetical protein
MAEHQFAVVQTPHAQIRHLDPIRTTLHDAGRKGERDGYGITMNGDTEMRAYDA